MDDVVVPFRPKCKPFAAPALNNSIKLGSCQASSEIIRRGQAVLERLECNLAWETEWRDLILALGEGREIALRAAGTDRPQGARYRKAIGPWLRCYGFDRIDEGDRSRLLKCFDNLAAINAWRSALPAEEQAKLNHPRTVLAHWQKSLRPKPEEPTNPPPGFKEPTDPLLAIWKQLSPEQRKAGLAAIETLEPEELRAALPASFYKKLNERLHDQFMRAHPRAKTFPTLEQALCLPTADTLTTH
jgi:hypothetical protein